MVKVIDASCDDVCLSSSSFSWQKRTHQFHRTASSSGKQKNSTLQRGREEKEREGERERGTEGERVYLISSHFLPLFKPLPINYVHSVSRPLTRLVEPQ